MNTAQITHALEEDPITNKKFCGVFPSDKLPQTIDKYPCEFVANTDPSTKPGIHWVSIYLSSPRKGSWFDSNDRKLQSDWSDVCGQYCIFFLSHRAPGYSMNKIVQLFDDNTMLNDAKVSHFVKTHFRVSVKHPNLNFIQFSQKLVQ